MKICHYRQTCWDKFCILFNFENNFTYAEKLFFVIKQSLACISGVKDVKEQLLNEFILFTREELKCEVTKIINFN